MAHPSVPVVVVWAGQVFGVAAVQAALLVGVTVLLRLRMAAVVAVQVAVLLAALVQTAL
jgi:hypothetical protein